jgi:hypothetical protein
MQGLWAGRDLYRATSTVTRDLGFSDLIRRTAPFSRLLRHTGCGGSIITWILTGMISKIQSKFRIWSKQTEMLKISNTNIHTKIVNLEFSSTESTKYNKKFQHHIDRYSYVKKVKLRVVIIAYTRGRIIVVGESRIITTRIDPVKISI